MIPFRWPSGKGKTIRTETRSVTDRGWGCGEGTDDKGVQGNEQFVMTEMFCILVLQVIAHLYIFVSTHWTAPLKRMHSTVCNLYLNKPDLEKRRLWLGTFKVSFKKKIYDQYRKWAVLLGILLYKITIIKTDTDTPPKRGTKFSGNSEARETSIQGHQGILYRRGCI